MHSALQRYIGQKIGDFTVLSLALEKHRSGRTLHNVECSCGELEVRLLKELQNTVRKGGVPRCRKCRSKNAAAWTRKISTTHNLTPRGNRLGNIYHGMMHRCYNPKRTYYRDYGGRGIKVCAEWHSIENFVKWANSNGYQADLTIERINNDGDYTPDNCRWATREEQSLNTRNTRFITHEGITKPLAVWARETGLKAITIAGRLNRGWSIERALTEPSFVGKNGSYGA